jgi:hypothetical protein
VIYWSASVCLAASLLSVYYAFVVLVKGKIITYCSAYAFSYRINEHYKYKQRNPILIPSENNPLVFHAGESITNL